MEALPRRGLHPPARTVRLAPGLAERGPNLEEREPPYNHGDDREHEG
jgi:hypothetical protein